MQIMRFRTRHLFLMILAIISVACNHVDEVTPRSYVSLVVGDLEQQRQIVARALSGGKSIPNSGPLKSELGEGAKTASMDFGWITATGTIIVHSKKYDVILIQEPTISQGKVVWSCVVFPTESKPKLCEIESSGPPGQ